MNESQEDLWYIWIPIYDICYVSVWFHMVMIHDGYHPQFFVAAFQCNGLVQKHFEKSFKQTPFNALEITSNKPNKRFPCDSKGFIVGAQKLATCQILWQMSYVILFFLIWFHYMFHYETSMFHYVSYVKIICFTRGRPGERGAKDCGQGGPRKGWLKNSSRWGKSSNFIYRLYRLVKHG